MTTQIYQQRTPTDWSGYTAINANKTGIANPARTTHMAWIAPALPVRDDLTITVKIYIDAGKSGNTPLTSTSLVIQGRAHTLDDFRTHKANTKDAWQTVTQKIDPTRPLKVEAPNAVYIDAAITITAVATVPNNPIPADVLTLEALLPIPTAALRWDISRWDRASWQTTRPAPGTLIWDEGKWDETYWEDQTLTETWTPIIGPCTRIHSRRGSKATGPVLSAEAGTLAIEATDDLNPRQLGMVYGTPIRLMHWPTATVIWTGYISDVATTPAKIGKGSTSIMATDNAARLVATTRYGAMPDGGGTETWANRLDRLVRSFPTGITHQVHNNDTTTKIVPTVWETTLANHLDALVASTGGAWAITRTGEIDVWATLPTNAPTLTLTDTHDTNAAGTIIDYAAGPSTWNASTVVAGIEATSHNAVKNTQGEWVADDQKTVITDTTAAASWGGMTVAVDVLTIPGASTEEAARRLLARASDAPILSSATYWPTHDHTPPTQRAPRMAYAATLDPITPTTAIQSGEQSTVLIADVTHDITPTTWKTDLTLTPKGTR